MLKHFKILTGQMGGARWCSSLLVLLVFSLLTYVSCSKASCGGERNEGDFRDSLRITFTGDLLLDRGVRKVIDYCGVESLFSTSIDSLFSQSDIVIANLECPATKVKSPVNKQFIFRAEPECLDALREHGITHLNMANNHSMDQGREGLRDTELQIWSHGMLPLGYGIGTEESARPIMLAEYPRKVFLLTSVLVRSENWINIDGTPCVSDCGVETIIHVVDSLKTADANSCVIVMLHWGAEHTLEPVLLQIQQARKIASAGADCIVGHHSHTLQTYEIYNGVPIFYGIGNFIFDQNKTINSFGGVVTSLITKDSISFSLLPIEIEKCTPHIVYDSLAIDTLLRINSR